MSEWYSYSLSDLLMFSPAAYFRLFELYNAAVWPAHLAAFAIALLLTGLVLRPERRNGRLIPMTLAIAWAFPAWAYFLRHYAQINLAAPYFAVAFGAEALLFAGTAIVGRLRFGWGKDPAAWVGVSLLMLAVAIFPLLEPLSGGSWAGAQFFALAPDPTAIGTLGLLLMASGPGRWLLLPLPVLWCGVSGFTHLVMDAPSGLVAPAAALLSVAFWRSGRGEGTKGRFSP
jgi:hypothetical protein